MDKLLELLARRHRNAAANSYPSSEKICDFSRQLMNLLFPEHKGKTISSANLLKDALDTLRDQDRKSVVWGRGLSERVDLGGSRIMKTKTYDHAYIYKIVERVTEI